jgi:hypothetical protein
MRGQEGDNAMVGVSTLNDAHPDGAPQVRTAAEAIGTTVPWSRGRRLGCMVTLNVTWASMTTADGDAAGKG